MSYSKRTIAVIALALMAFSVVMGYYILIKSIVTNILVDRIHILGLTFTKWMILAAVFALIALVFEFMSMKDDGL